MYQAKRSVPNVAARNIANIAEKMFALSEALMTLTHKNNMKQKK
jgi:hypothetical protein